jgi:hypothetical protein
MCAFHFILYEKVLYMCQTGWKAFRKCKYTFLPAVLGYFAFDPWPLLAPLFGAFSNRPPVHDILSADFLQVYHRNFRARLPLELEWNIEPTVPPVVLQDAAPGAGKACRGAWELLQGPTAPDFQNVPTHGRAARPEPSRLAEPCQPAMSALTPSVSWAQRPSLIFLTINVSDVVDPEIKVLSPLPRRRVPYSLPR